MEVDEIIVRSNNGETTSKIFVYDYVSEIEADSGNQSDDNSEPGSGAGSASSTQSYNVEEVAINEYIRYNQNNEEITSQPLSNDVQASIFNKEENTNEQPNFYNYYEASTTEPLNLDDKWEVNTKEPQSNNENSEVPNTKIKTENELYTNIKR